MARRVVWDRFSRSAVIPFRIMAVRISSSAQAGPRVPQISTAGTLRFMFVVLLSVFSALLYQIFFPDANRKAVRERERRIDEREKKPYN